MGTQPSKVFGCAFLKNRQTYQGNLGEGYISVFLFHKPVTGVNPRVGLGHVTPSSCCFDNLQHLPDVKSWEPWRAQNPAITSEGATQLGLQSLSRMGRWEDKTKFHSTKPQEAPEEINQDGRVEECALTPSCESTRITTGCWTIIDRKTLDFTKEDTPHPRTEEKPQ